MSLNKRCHLASTKVSQSCGLAQNKFLKELTFKYPSNTKQTLHRVLVISSALWAIDSLSQQDNGFKKAIIQLIKMNPLLDYKKFW